MGVSPADRGPDPAADHVARVRRFYNRNTGRFRRFGQGGAAIHRAVWGPRVVGREQAFSWVEGRILALLSDHAQPRVVDLGCGVGGSLIHLASRRPDLTGDGVTISPAQAAVAGELLERAGLSARVRVREGDFLAPPEGLGGADLVFSIEAFVHGPDPAAYFRVAAGLLRPGGLLVLCDDLLTRAGAAAPPRAARQIERFRDGWRLASLVTVDEVTRLATAAGLRNIDDDDLTPYLELGRPRDRGVGLLVAVTRPLRLRGEYWASLAGGHALQRCLASDLVGYRLLVFQRAPDPVAGGAD